MAQDTKRESSISTFLDELEVYSDGSRDGFTRCLELSRPHAEKMAFRIRELEAEVEWLKFNECEKYIRKNQK